MLTAIQTDWQARLAADPAYAFWSERHHAAAVLTFDEWLDTPEGQDWLNMKAEQYDAVIGDFGYSWERPL
jgi:hypothetical protein